MFKRSKPGRSNLTFQCSMCEDTSGYIKTIRSPMGLDRKCQGLGFIFYCPVGFKSAVYKNRRSHNLLLQYHLPWEALLH